MSSTRLLVLGVVRIFQPAHGYFVRRELLSWHADQWAKLNPGSVYNALRAMTREGLLEQAGTEAKGGRPARTSYRLTAAGEAEFRELAWSALWNVDPFAPDLLLTAWGFAWTFSRAEVLQALDHRLESIEASREGIDGTIEHVLSDPGTPAYVAEHVRLTQARLDGEEEWIVEVSERIRGGEYWFEGDPGSREESQF
jgi:DNA-binding PadR family transcriptional regulator